MLEFCYRDERISIVVLDKKAEAAANNNNFATICRIIKELAGSRKPFEGRVSSINGRLLIYDHEQVKR